MCDDAEHAKALPKALSIARVIVGGKIYRNIYDLEITRDNFQKKRWFGGWSKWLVKIQHFQNGQKNADVPLKHRPAAFQTAIF